MKPVQQCGIIGCESKRHQLDPYCPEHWMMIPAMIRKEIRKHADALATAAVSPEIPPEKVQESMASYVGAITVAAEMIQRRQHETGRRLA